MRNAFIFILASFLVSAAVYRDAMWGASMLAPLDIGPDMFRCYGFMDAEADGIPENHHIIDQFTYDLPLQHTIHSSYRSGEIPWWDPHTYGGRPLLADAHINGTDPVRVLCYHLLRFELAYNWNYILRGILTGLGMFLLLCRLGVSPAAAGIFGITYQFAGWFTLFFGHPWIQGAFVWYPFLWWVLIGLNKENFGIRVAAAGCFCALVFYSGNLQSHTYLPIFMLALLGAAVLKERAKVPRLFGACALAGVVGALFAFPVLSNQVEFYLLGVRSPSAGTWDALRLTSAPVALAGFYPWVFGSFKTLDAAKFVGAGGVAYTLFFGTSGFLLAVVAAMNLRRTKGNAGVVVWQCLLLLAGYLIIISTPLNAIFYTRSAALGGMALIVLAGLGLQAVLDGSIPLPRRTAVGFASLVLIVSLVSSAAVWFVYPRFQPALEKRFSSPDTEEKTAFFAFSSLGDMRLAQIDRFPSEVSIMNPQAASGLLSAILLGVAFGGSMGKTARRRLVHASLGMGLLAVLIFHARFRPKQPVHLWKALVEGGPAQKEALALAEGGLRLDETGIPLPDMIFPNAMASLFQTHAIYGYSALQPRSLLVYPRDAPPPPAAWRADLMAKMPDAAERPIISRSGSSPSRFRNVADGSPAPIPVVEETQNSLVLDVSQLDPGAGFIRTDTGYPGWTGSSGYRVRHAEPCFSEVIPGTADGASQITLRYRPTFSSWNPAAIAAGLLITAIPVVVPLARKKKVAGVGDPVQVG